MTPLRAQARFLDLLDQLDHPRETASPLKGFFDRARPLHIARAPGRLDVMGGIADYSGSLVLEMPILEATFAACQPTNREELHLASVPLASIGAPRVQRWSWPELLSLTDYAAARDWFASRVAGHWSAYLAGVVLLLAREHGLECRGLKLLVASNVPEGKGAGSSAAVEVSVMHALNACFGRGLSAETIALECQRVENRIVGAPCGVMDQLTSSLGREGELLEIQCQPATIEGSTPLPIELGVWGIDSGLRHAVSGADYGQVRVAAFMGYRIIAELLGLDVEPSSQPGRVKIVDPRYSGYLANISPEEFARDFEPHLPQVLEGRGFLERYTGISDEVTRIDPDRSYPVAAATAHPVRENARVRRFRELLRLGDAQAHDQELGQLMFESHASYSACGLGSTGTDRLVELVRGASHETELLGAKITGGGSGGTVAILGRSGAAQQVRDVAQRYTEETGHEPHVFEGSSPGAAEFGTHVARHTGRSWRLASASP